ncbi:MAG TPA: outer membrane protein assembly factor BamA, partial [Candidatus Marinimicrobia bacterium]|nr:outer membrane protein assembly factor BamA [Candidatus Neomarinimicrobiota bacterium]
MKLARNLYSLIVLCFALSSFSIAQTQQQISILGVAVKGNKTISENSIKIQSGIIEGKDIIFDDIPQAIKRLFKLKIFSDIQIYVDKATDNGLFLIIQV